MELKVVVNGVTEELTNYKSDIVAKDVVGWILLKAVRKIGTADVRYEAVDGGGFRITVTGVGITEEISLTQDEA